MAAASRVIPVRSGPRRRDGGLAGRPGGNTQRSDATDPNRGGSEMADTREPRDPAAGPLVVSPKNPRFFIAKSDPHERAVYLAGSHIWHNFHDGLGTGEPAAKVPRAWTSMST